MNTYKLAKIWQSLLIVPSVCLILLFWSLVFIEDDLSGIPVGAWVFIITVTAISSSFIYNAVTSKIITSPEGIASVSFGIRVNVAWDKVEGIDVNQQGFVNLVFKEAIYRNRLVNILLSPLAYEKTFQLSPYIDDLATSNLPRDIAKYAPVGNIPAFVAQQKRSTKTYQKAGMIGLYYFGWFIVLFLFAIGFQNSVEEYFAKVGLINTGLILDFVAFSLVIGLFVSTISLLKRYNGEIDKLGENEVSHRARAYYITPLIIALISSVIGVAIWIFLRKTSDFEVYLMFLIGVISLWVSSKIERLLFTDNGQ